MADIRISELPAASAGATTDLFATTQGSTGAGTGVTRKITTEQIFALLVSPPAIGTNTPAAGKFTTLELTETSRFSNAILPATGTTQGTAAAIITDYVDAITSASNTGVILPAALPGMRKVISGNSANDILYPVQLYPASGEELYVYTSGSLGANFPQAILIDEAFVVECTVAGRWYAYQIS